MEGDRLSQNIRILKEWYEKQPHLPKEIDENYFLTFAKGCKSLEIAKKKIDSFFSLRGSQIWWTDFDRMFERFKNEKGGDIFFLPGKTPEGWRVMMASYVRENINKMDSQVELFRRMISVELAISRWFEDTSVMIIFDLKGADLSYCAALNLPSEIACISYAQTVMPFKLKKSVLVNTTPLLEKTCNLVRPFFSKKMSERLGLYTGTKILCEILPLSMIPKEYGGDAGTVQELGDGWKKEILAHENWFRKNARLTSDESKRPNDGSGLDSGTFRKLQID